MPAANNRVQASDALLRVVYEEADAIQNAVTATDKHAAYLRYIQARERFLKFLMPGLDIAHLYATVAED